MTVMNTQTAGVVDPILSKHARGYRNAEMIGQAVFRVEGAEVALSPENFDRARDMVGQIRAQEKLDRQSAVQARRAPDAPESYTPERGGLAEKAMQGVQEAPRTDTQRSQITPEQALERIAYVEQQAKVSGWNRRLTEMREQMREIAAPLIEADSREVEDAGSGIAEQSTPQTAGKPALRMDDARRDGGASVEAGGDPDARADGRGAEMASQPAEPATGLDTTPGSGGNLAVATDAGQPDRAVTIEPIRQKAAVIRGLDQDAVPEVPGVSIKWDAREGGFIFARKHTAKVQAALGAQGQDAANVAQPNTVPAIAPAEQLGKEYRAHRSQNRPDAPPARPPQPGSPDYTRDQAISDLHALEAQRDGGMFADLSRRWPLSLRHIELTCPPKDPSL
ncbi:MAG: hypothetical protein Q4G24_12640 [Paracoccus sp. (in: a-proteobacteria)]|uniref:hypothetical protein n=1 Tax=Paracoccus sp. TaxID=267 RepID=UPI0026DF5518|nr:hypothetical protein [Paracoccus sp. (in: a-proteobacteria)]MDO5622306.1 hypothetical protein [Paracoccus sp. (in: a-proteobacteria)]